MKQTRRKLWTWTISTVAGLLVSAAVVTGLFRGAVLLVPGYRHDLERRLSELSGYAVRIGEMDMRWRGLSPALDLDDILVQPGGAQQPAVHLRQLVISTSLLRLVRGDWMPTVVEVEGLSLAAERGEDGRWSVRGFDRPDQSGPVELQPLLDRLVRLRELRLVDCALLVRAPQWFGDSVHGFVFDRLRLGIGDHGSRIEAALQLPADFGRRLQLQAALQGPLNRPEQWRLDAELQAPELDLAAVLAPWIVNGRTLAVEDAALRLQAQMHSLARPATLDFELASARVLAGDEQMPPAELENLALQGRWQPAEAGWSLAIESLRLDGAAGPWPESRGSLRYRRRPGGGEWRADLAFLRFDDLAPLLAAVDVGGAARLAGARGDLSNGVLHFSQDAQGPRFRYRAELDNAGFDDGEYRFVGLSGPLSGDEQAGRLQARSAPAVFVWPSFFGAPIEFESLAGEFSWRRTVDGWRLAVESAPWQLLSGSGEAEAEIVLPRQGSGRLRVTSTLQADDVVALKALMPIKWRPSLRGWLQRAIEGGRVPGGRLSLDAAFSELGNKRIPDGFELDLQVADARLAFLPEWPAVQDLEAQLRFRGNGLTVRADRGDLAGLGVGTVQAQFADFSDRMLTIDGRLNGDAARFYQVLSRTPLRQRLSALLEHTDAAGATSLDLALEIPLASSEPSRVAGDILLDGASLELAGLPQPVEAIEGTVHFDGDGVRAENLTGRWRGIDLRAQLAPLDPKTTELNLDFALQPGDELFDEVPPWIRSRLQGRSDWVASIRLGGDGGPQPIRLHSDLAGLAVDLPAPLYADAGEAGPLELELLRDEEAGGMRFEARQGQRLTVRGLLADAVEATESIDSAAASPPAPRRAEAGGRLRYLQVWFGASPPSPPPRGIVVGGKVDEVDARGWSRIYRHGGAGADAADPQVEVEVEALRYGPLAARKVAVQAAHDAAGWSVILAGDNRGSLRYPDDPTGTVVARFERLALVNDQAAGNPQFDAAGEPLDPTAQPTLDLRVGEMTLDEVPLGEFTLRTTRLPDGQRIERLSTTKAGLRSQVTGQWTRVGGRSRAALNFEIESNRIDEVLAAFGYTPNLEARAAQFRGSLSWDEVGGGLSLAQARGRVGLSAERGRLRTVEPGAGRVLGLMNFYALPRRLTLNFSDVVGEGLAFDRISGGFELGDGEATTEDLDIEAPAVRIEMRGTIGLAERNYDQRVTVYPDMSGGVTLGAVLLGGPAVGIIALLAQELLDKPLDQVSQLSYHVTGSWDNPQIDRIDGGG